MSKAVILFILAIVLNSCTTSLPKPIKALLLTGGCCHDYDSQKNIIQKFTTQSLNIKWDIIHEGGKGREHKFSIYTKKGWAKKYDVIVHNECFASNKDDDSICKDVVLSSAITLIS